MTNSNKIACTILEKLKEVSIDFVTNIFQTNSKPLKIKSVSRTCYFFFIFKSYFVRFEFFFYQNVQYMFIVNFAVKVYVCDVFSNN